MAAVPAGGDPAITTPDTPTLAVPTLADTTAVPPLSDAIGSNTLAGANAAASNASTTITPAGQAPRPVAATDVALTDANTRKTVTLTATQTETARPSPPPAVLPPSPGNADASVNPNVSLLPGNGNGNLTKLDTGQANTNSLFKPTDVRLQYTTDGAAPLRGVPSASANATAPGVPTATPPTNTTHFTDSPFQINVEQNDESTAHSQTPTPTPTPKPDLTTTLSSRTTTSSSRTVSPPAKSPLPDNLTPGGGQNSTLNSVGNAEPLTVESPTAPSPSGPAPIETTYITAGKTLTGSAAVAAASAAAAGQDIVDGKVVDKGKEPFSTGAIIGIIGGAVGLVFLLIILCCYMSKRRLKKAREEVSDEELEKNLDDHDDAGDFMYGNNGATHSGFDFIDVPITPRNDGGSRTHSRNGRRKDRGRSTTDPFDDRYSQHYPATVQSYLGPARPDSGIVDPDPYSAAHGPFTDRFQESTHIDQLEEALDEEYRTVGRGHRDERHLQAPPSREDPFAPSHPAASSYDAARQSTYSAHVPQEGDYPGDGNYHSIYGAYVSSRPGTMYDPTDGLERPPQTAATAATAALLPWLRDPPPLPPSEPVQESQGYPTGNTKPTVPKKAKRKPKRRNDAPPRAVPQAVAPHRSAAVPSQQPTTRAAPRAMMAQTPVAYDSNSWPAVIPNFR